MIHHLSEGAKDEVASRIVQVAVGVEQLQDRVLDGLLGTTCSPVFSFLHEIIELCRSDTPGKNHQINGRNNIERHAGPSRKHETSRSIIVLRPVQTRTSNVIRSADQCPAQSCYSSHT